MRYFLLLLTALNFIHYASRGQNTHADYIQSIRGTQLSFQMKAVPGGKFRMGDASGKPDERPVRTVELDPFWIGSVEVTWDLFEPFIYKDFEAANSSEVPAEVDAVTRPTKPYLDMTFGMGKTGHPALAMTHYNAIQYCKWLYARTGVFYRLPTEAEWEYAARAGSETSYFFGNDSGQLNRYAWYAGNSGDKTHPVGGKLANPFGLFDIYGNVAEWTYDQYVEDQYSRTSAIVKNPVATPEKLYPHVIRGGSYSDPAEHLRSAARLASDPEWKQLDPQIPKSNWWFPEAPFIGFRLVRPVSPPSKTEIERYYNTAPIADY